MLRIALFGDSMTYGAEVELEESYHAWCKTTGLDPVSNWTFKHRLVERDIVDGRVGKCRLWRGIRLRTEDDDKSDKLKPLSPKLLYEENIEKSPVPEVNNVTPKLKENQFVTKVTQEVDLPAYPITPCQVCGGNEYQLTEDDKWLCVKCHPIPEGK